MTEEEARKIATQEGADNKTATAAVASEDAGNATEDAGRHAEATESVTETPKAEHGVADHDNGTKPSESHTEAENGNAGCGCGRVTHDGSTKARKPRTHKGHDTLLLALGIVGVVLGASGLAVACSVSNEVTELKSNVANMQDSVDGNMSVLPQFELLDDDDAYDDWLDRHGLSDDGDTRVGFLGVRVQDSTTGTNGAEVVGVSVGEPAEKAGIEKGDVIVSFAGENVTDAEDLVDLVRDAKIGSTQSVVIMRDGSTKTLSVTVGSTLG